MRMKKYFYGICGIAVLVALACRPVAAQEAELQTAAETAAVESLESAAEDGAEAAVTATEEAEAADVVKAEDVTLTVGQETYTIINLTGMEIIRVEVSGGSTGDQESAAVDVADAAVDADVRDATDDAADAAMDAETTDADAAATDVDVETTDADITGSGTGAADAANTDAEDIQAVTLTAEDGSEHRFEDFPKSMTDPALTTDDGFLFITYKNEAGEQKMACETADEVVFDEPVSKYIVDRVNVRAEASADSAIVGVAELGCEVKAVSAYPRWVKIELEDGQTGYIARPYVSPDKSAAETAVQTENAVRAAQEAAAAAAARAAAQAAAAAGSQGGGKTVVSRQNFDDCDGSGHGYAIVTYSDGSTATVNY